MVARLWVPRVSTRCGHKFHGWRWSLSWGVNTWDTRGPCVPAAAIALLGQAGQCPTSTRFRRQTNKQTNKWTSPVRKVRRFLISCWKIRAWWSGRAFQILCIVCMRLGRCRQVIGCGIVRGTAEHATYSGWVPYNAPSARRTWTWCRPWRAPPRPRQTSVSNSSPTNDGTVLLSSVLRHSRPTWPEVSQS